MDECIAVCCLYNLAENVPSIMLARGTHWLEIFTMNLNNLEDLLQHRLRCPTLRVSASVAWGRALEFTFLTSSQMLLLNWKPHFENL